MSDHPGASLYRVSQPSSDNEYISSFFASARCIAQKCHRSAQHRDQHKGQHKGPVLVRSLPLHSILLPRRLPTSLTFSFLTALFRSRFPPQRVCECLNWCRQIPSASVWRLIPACTNTWEHVNYDKKCHKYCCLQPVSWSREKLIHSKPH